MLYVPIQLHAQDIHFSQFFASPLTLNPALAGMHNYDLRIVDNYRSQWFTLGVPYNSNAVSADFPIYTQKRTFAGSLLAVYDASGDARLRVSKIYGSFSYILKKKDQVFALALQPGYVLKNFDIGSITFPDQYNVVSGTFDPNLPTSGNYSGNQISYFDANAGAYWSGTFEKFNVRSGLSMYHLNRPKESFLNNNNTLSIRTQFFANASFELSQAWSLQPMLLYMEQEKASQFQLGTLLRMNNIAKQSIEYVYYGAFIRTGYKRNIDAAVFHVGTKYKEIGLGLSYDVNISSLRQISNYQGALEISIIYGKLNSLLNQITIPCERF